MYDHGHIKDHVSDIDMIITGSVYKMYNSYTHETTYPLSIRVRNGNFSVDHEVYDNISTYWYDRLQVKI